MKSLIFFMIHQSVESSAFLKMFKKGECSTFVTEVSHSIEDVFGLTMMAIPQLTKESAKPHCEAHKAQVDALLADAIKAVKTRCKEHKRANAVQTLEEVAEKTKNKMDDVATLKDLYFRAKEGLYTFQGPELCGVLRGHFRSLKASISPDLWNTVLTDNIGDLYMKELEIRAAMDASHTDNSLVIENTMRRILQRVSRDFAGREKNQMLDNLANQFDDYLADKGFPQHGYSRGKQLCAEFL
jgi:hypothetical protein